MPQRIDWIVCPYCFTKCEIRDLKFRCLTPTCPAMAQDPIFASYRGIPPVRMGAVLMPRKKFGGSAPTSVQCGGCNQFGETRICPICHFELPLDVDHIDQYIIAIIGGRLTGKSHYLASLISRLNYEVGDNFDITVRMIGQETKERWQRDFHEPLFVNHTQIVPNQPAALDPVVKSPLVFQFQFNEKTGLLKKTKRIRTLTVSFFDSAGEDMKSLSNMVVQNRYIRYADGIIFLLDPLQIPYVRAQLPKHNIQLPPEDWRYAPANIVDNLVDLLNSGNRPKTAQHQKIDVPVAFTLAKIDMLRPLLAPTSPLRNPSNHPGFVNLNDLESVNTEVTSFLEKWINRAFIRKIENDFAEYSFFGVSALGAPPDANGHLSMVSPFRVEDPLLWLLLRLDLLGRNRGRRP